MGYVWCDRMTLAESHQEMTFLVRHLAPTEHGLPIEIYVFSRDQEWSTYEDIQSDIFDHILAVANEFDLRVYQTASGADVRTLMSIEGTDTLTR